MQEIVPRMLRSRPKLRMCRYTIHNMSMLVDVRHNYLLSCAIILTDLYDLLKICTKSRVAVFDLISLILNSEKNLTQFYSLYHTTPIVDDRIHLRSFNARFHNIYGNNSVIIYQLENSWLHQWSKEKRGFKNKKGRGGKKKNRIQSKNSHCPWAKRMYKRN